MIPPQRHNGVVGGTRGLESIQNSTKLCVDVRYAGIVVLPKLLCKRHWQRSKRKRNVVCSNDCGDVISRLHVCPRVIRHVWKQVWKRRVWWGLDRVDRVRLEVLRREFEWDLLRRHGMRQKSGSTGVTPHFENNIDFHREEISSRGKKANAASSRAACETQPRPTMALLPVVTGSRATPLRNPQTGGQEAIPLAWQSVPPGRGCWCTTC